MSRSFNIEIRSAVENDLPGVARVLVDTWRSTFRGLLPDSFLDGMSYAHQEQRHRRTMNLEGTCYQVAVNEHDDIIGFANGGPARGDNASADAELYALYVAQSWHGHGTGKSLFKAVADELRERGHASMSVWVLAVNPAVGFYERLGGIKKATKSMDIDGATFLVIELFWDDIEMLLKM